MPELKNEVAQGLSIKNVSTFKDNSARNLSEVKVCSRTCWESSVGTCTVEPFCLNGLPQKQFQAPTLAKPFQSALGRDHLFALPASGPLKGICPRCQETQVHQIKGLLGYSSLYMLCLSWKTLYSPDRIVPEGPLCIFTGHACLKVSFKLGSQLCRLLSIWSQYQISALWDLLESAWKTLLAD